MHYYSNYKAATGEGFTYLEPIGNTTATNKVQIQSTANRSVLLKYRLRLYDIGKYPRLRMFNEHGQEHLGGMIAPANAPTLTAGASSGGSTGSFYGVLVFRQKIGNTIIQQSNPSAPSNSLNLTGQGRVWGSIPTTSPDPHATHVAILVSQDGSVPAEAAERMIGVTSITENQLGTQLLNGEFHVVTSYTSQIDNAVSTDLNARGVPPYCAAAEIYHDTICYGADPLHPTRIYPSKPFEPTAVNAVQSIADVPSGYLETNDGDNVIGLQRHGDELIVGTTGGFYAIQGYGPGDYTIRKINSFYGLLNHFTMVRCGKNSDLWMLSQEGVILYNGTFRNIMEHWHSFIRDEYALHSANYEAAYAGEDRFWGGYKLRIPQDDQTSLYYYGHYAPVDAGGQPFWVVDRRNRNDSGMAELEVANDARRKVLATGSCDGYVRYENVASNTTDDSDTYNKAMTVVFAHYFSEREQVGDDAHGATWGPMWAFVKNPTNDITVSAYGGDDNAYSAAGPVQSRAIKATNAATGQRATIGGTSQQMDLNEVSGDGITIKLFVTAPLSVEVRGYSTMWRKGPNINPFR